MVKINQLGPLVPSLLFPIMYPNIQGILAGLLCLLACSALSYGASND